MNKKKIIYICYRNIASLDAGDKIVSYSFIKQLSEIHEIYLINILDEGKYNELELTNLKSIVNSLSIFNEKEKIVTLKSFFESLVSRIPILIARKSRRHKIAHEIKGIVSHFKPDLIIWDHNRVLAYFDDSFFKLNNILIEHNNESELLHQRGKNKPFPLKMVYYWQSSLIQTMTTYFYSKLNKIIYISSFDVSNLKTIPTKYYRLQKLNLYFQHSAFKLPTSNKKNLIFIGSLEWYSNIEGIKWFIQKVYPLIKENITLTIIGRTPTTDILNLKNDHINIFSNVVSIEPYILNANIFIAPILSGGGINIKILEALSYGIPIVGTSHSFRGYDELDFLRGCNDPVEFADEIDRLLNESEYYKDIYNEELSYYSKYQELSKNELIKAIEI